MEEYSAPKCMICDVYLTNGFQGNRATAFWSLNFGIDDFEPKCIGPSNTVKFGKKTFLPICSECATAVVSSLNGDMVVQNYFNHHELANELFIYDHILKKDFIEKFVIVAAERIKNENEEANKEQLDTKTQ